MPRVKLTDHIEASLSDDDAEAWELANKIIKDIRDKYIEPNAELATHIRKMEDLAIAPALSAARALKAKHISPFGPSVSAWIDEASLVKYGGPKKVRRVVKLPTSTIAKVGTISACIPPGAVLTKQDYLPHEDVIMLEYEV